MSETSLQLSIIVVTHNSAGVLAQCLSAVDDSVVGFESELIVVDNGSNDSTLDLVRSHSSGIRIIDLPRNRGFAAACNEGAAAAEGEQLLFLNPDVIVDPNAISGLMSAAEADHNPGLVSGRLRYPDGRFQATCRNLPSISNIFFSRGTAIGRRTDHDSCNRYTLPDYESTTRVPAVAATLVMIRRDLLEKIGRFDPRFFMYMEDTDLSARLHMADYHNLFVPSAGGVHAWGSGSSTGRIKRLWHHHMSFWRYFLKHIPNGFSVIVLPALLLVNFVIRLLLPSRSGGETP